MISEVYLGDCMDFMAQFPDKFFELAIVDPPYGIGRDEGFGGFGGFGGSGKPIARKRYKAWGDDSIPEKEYFDRLRSVSYNQIIWGGQFFTEHLPTGKHWLFWDKLNTMPTFGDGELAFTSFNRASVKRFTYQYNGLLSGEKCKRIHATQKPIALYKWLLKNYANPGDKILDTHMGSQSSRIACWDMGFDFWGSEIDADYFRDGCKRFEQFKAQLKLPLI